MALSKIQGLFFRNDTDLSEQLETQNTLRESFVDALTGCPMIVAALNTQIRSLIGPKKAKPKERSSGIGFQVKAEIFWKEETMKQLLDPSRG